MFSFSLNRDYELATNHKLSWSIRGFLILHNANKMKCWTSEGLPSINIKPDFKA